jgi:glucuronokinase
VRVVRRVSARAYARAGLLGNPSDVYGGKAIAISVGNFAACVTLEEADHFEILRGPAETLSFPSFRSMSDDLRARGCYDGIRLLRSAVKRFADRWEGLAALAEDDPRLRFTLRYETDIPRQLGLGGSSAIVTAELRALMAWFDVEIEPAELAEIALAAEVEDLGITAGPMDRVIQVYGGVVHMDFAPPRAARSYTRLDPGLLPPLFMAWRPRTGRVSAHAHGDTRARWLRGDPGVRAAMEQFAGLVDQGLVCLERRDVGGFQKLVDRNFDLRTTVMNLHDDDHEMVRIGRAQGAAVKLCGSGGAVIGVMRDEAEFPAIEEAYAQRGYHTLRPRIAPEPGAPHRG